MVQEMMGNSIAEAEQVLLARSAHGHRVALVRHSDDGLAITVDGRPHFRWPATCVDSCVRVYLDLLRDPNAEHMQPVGS